LSTETGLLINLAEILYQKKREGSTVRFKDEEKPELDENKEVIVNNRERFFFLD